MIREPKRRIFNYGLVEYCDDFYELQLHIDAWPTYYKRRMLCSSKKVDVINAYVIFLGIHVKLVDRLKDRLRTYMSVRDVSERMLDLCEGSVAFQIARDLADKYLGGGCSKREVRLSKEDTKLLEDLFEIKDANLKKLQEAQEQFARKVCTGLGVRK